MQATDKLPTVADLSSCQLEYLPENLFVNDQLSVLNLQHNTLREKPVDDDDIYVIGWLDDLARSVWHLYASQLTRTDPRDARIKTKFHGSSVLEASSWQMFRGCR